MCACVRACVLCVSCVCTPQFHPWGLSNTDYPPFKSLPSIIRELGHEGREISILKIDAEGAEYEVRVCVCVYVCVCVT